MLMLTLQPITAQCCFSISPENIRKPKVFGGYRKATRGCNGLNTNPTKWLNIRKHCLSMFDHFVGLALKGLTKCNQIKSLSTTRRLLKN